MDTETILVFHFRLYDSLVVSALQDAACYVITYQNDLGLHLGFHTCWLSYFALVSLWCRQTVTRMYRHLITKICWMGRLPHFLTRGALLHVLRGQEIRYDNYGINIVHFYRVCLLRNVMCMWFLWNFHY